MSKEELVSLEAALKRFIHERIDDGQAYKLDEMAQTLQMVNTVLFGFNIDVVQKGAADVNSAN